MAMRSLSRFTWQGWGDEADVGSIAMILRPIMKLMENVALHANEFRVHDHVEIAPSRCLPQSGFLLVVGRVGRVGRMGPSDDEAGS